MSDSKKDPILGERVRAHLELKGVETPVNAISFGNNDEKKLEIENHVASIMTILGLNLSDDSLRDTPRRVAKMYVDELFYGLDYSNFPKCTAVDNKMSYDEMLIERNVTVGSSCEHHLITIWGTATVAYIPKDKVLGLSKINRIVDFFAKRPQIQERLTEQIYHTLSFILGTADIAVIIDAEHYCVKARGIRDTSSSTVSSKLGGAFLKPSVRAEFMSIANKPK
jgi:GTP cyclohydrolase IA